MKKRASTHDSAEVEMLSFFLEQKLVTSEDAAKKLLRSAKSESENYVGGRIVAPERPNQKRWIVQTCYKATQDTPPPGMAKLSIPAVKSILKGYGIHRDN